MIKIGKVYDTLPYIGAILPFYKIISDCGSLEFYEPKCFIPLAEYRDKQIEEILND